MQVGRVPSNDGREGAAHAQVGSQVAKTMASLHARAAASSGQDLEVISDHIARVCRAFTGMRMDVAGEMHVDDIKGSLRKLGVPATDANAHAMIK